jgi:hypothetical protein
LATKQVFLLLLFFIIEVCPWAQLRRRNKIQPIHIRDCWYTPDNLSINLEDIQVKYTVGQGRLIDSISEDHPEPIGDDKRIRLILEMNDKNLLEAGLWRIAESQILTHIKYEPPTGLICKANPLPPL